MLHLTKFCGISSIFSESVSFSNSLKIRIDLRAQPAFFLRIGMEKWLSGRKRFFAKEVNLKRVPWVQIPSSPPLFKTRETLAGFFVYSPVCDDDDFANKWVFRSDTLEPARRASASISTMWAEPKKHEDRHSGTILAASCSNGHGSIGAILSKLKAIDLAQRQCFSGLRKTL